MLNETLAALAAAVGTGLVSAMTTDAWQQVRARTVKLLGRGEPREEERQDSRLEESRQQVVSAPDDEIERVVRQQGEAWRFRLESLLEQTPEAEAELRQLKTFLKEIEIVDTTESIRVEARAFDQAQQAVQGQGFQSNTFSPPSTKT